jgi:L-methionine (R)-S-oxide reductase
MHAIQQTAGLSKPAAYRELNQQLAGLFEGERNALANAANMASLIYHLVPNLNWAGFYFLQGGELVLGPFHGQPACVRIALGKGVCGTAAQQRRTQLVEDVHAFPGHIACDSASNSEVVVPLIDRGHLYGVLDLDSPTLRRFDAEDVAGLEAAAGLFVKASDLQVFFKD